MYTKVLILSAIASAILIAATPMVPASMSTDNGGTKSAIDAYSDGGGVLIINQAGDTKFDNSAMNGLVFKYGEAAKSSNTTLKNQVSVLSTDASSSEKSISVKFDLAKVTINPPVNGTSCDDGMLSTSGDTWINGVCSGIANDGVACDDTNSMTYGDKYNSGVCQGVYATTCSDIHTADSSKISGAYLIDPDGASGAAPFSVYCDMTTDGGGWTAIVNTWSPFYQASHNPVLVSLGQYIKSFTTAPFQFKEIRYMTSRNGLHFDVKRVAVTYSNNLLRVDYSSFLGIGGNNYTGSFNWTYQGVNPFEFHYFNGDTYRLIYRINDVHSIAKYELTGTNNANLGSYGLVFIR